MVSMKTLTTSERARILHLLCEGTSIRAVCRLTGASKNTVAKLLGDVGRVCMAYHDKHVRDLKSNVNGGVKVGQRAGAKPGQFAALA